VTAPCEAGPFSLAANKHPGPCWYCGKRVRKGAGCLWREARASGAWTVGHTDCVASGIQDGHGPQVATGGPGGGGKAAREAEARARIEAGEAPREAPPRPYAVVLRDVRDVMRAVRLDAPEDELARAVGVLLGVLGSGEAVPF